MLIVFHHLICLAKMKSNMSKETGRHAFISDNIPMRTSRPSASTASQCLRMDVSKLPADVWTQVVSLHKDENLQKFCYDLMFHQTLTNLLSQHAEFLKVTESKHVVEDLRKLCHDYLLKVSMHFIERYDALSIPAKEVFVDTLYQQCETTFKKHKIGHYSPDRRKMGLENLLQECHLFNVNNKSTMTLIHVPSASVVGPHQPNQNFIQQGNIWNTHNANPCQYLNANQMTQQNIRPPAYSNHHIGNNIAQYLHSNSLLSSQMQVRSVIQQQYQEVHSANQHNYVRQPVVVKQTPKETQPNYSNFQQHSISTFSGNSVMAASHSMQSSMPMTEFPNTNQIIDLQSFNNPQVNYDDSMAAHQTQYIANVPVTTQNPLNNDINSQMPLSEFANPVSYRLTKQEQPYTLSKTPVSNQEELIARPAQCPTEALRNLFSHRMIPPATGGVQLTAIQSSTITLTNSAPTEQAIQSDSDASENLSNVVGQIKIIAFPGSEYQYELTNASQNNEVPVENVSDVAAQAEPNAKPYIELETSANTVKIEYDGTLERPGSPSQPILVMPSMPEICAPVSTQNAQEPAIVNRKEREEEILIDFQTTEEVYSSHLFESIDSQILSSRVIESSQNATNITSNKNIDNMNGGVLNSANTYAESSDQTIHDPVNEVIARPTFFNNQADGHTNVITDHEISTQNNKIDITCHKKGSSVQCPSINASYSNDTTQNNANSISTECNEITQIHKENETIVVTNNTFNNTQHDLNANLDQNTIGKLYVKPNHNIARNQESIVMNEITSETLVAVSISEKTREASNHPSESTSGSFVTVKNNILPNSKTKPDPQKSINEQIDISTQNSPKDQNNQSDLPSEPPSPSKTPSPPALPAEFSLNSTSSDMIAQITAKIEESFKRKALLSQEKLSNVKKSRLIEQNDLLASSSKVIHEQCAAFEHPKPQSDQNTSIAKEKQSEPIVTEKPTPIKTEFAENQTNETTSQSSSNIPKILEKQGSSFSSNQPDVIFIDLVSDDEEDRNDEDGNDCRIIDKKIEVIDIADGEDNVPSTSNQEFDTNNHNSAFIQKTETKPIGFLVI